METRSYTVYKFNELPKEAQEKALNEYRYFNVDFNGWSDCVIDDFLLLLKDRGYTTTKNDVFFSGFCSQGDGACFDGKGYMDLINYAIKENKNFKPLQRLCDEGAFTVTILRSSYSNHYCHEKTRYIDIECDGIISTKEKELIEELTFWLEDDRIDLCRQLYESLKKEYNFLTSDEAVAESLVSNDYDFTINGKID